MENKKLSLTEKKDLLDSLVTNLRKIRRKNTETKITQEEQQTAESILDTFSL